MRNQSLGKIVEDIFSEAEISLQTHHFIMTRGDGVIIYSNRLESESKAALLGGLWQAANQLRLMSEIEGSENSFRLNYDLSNKGISIRCIDYQNKQYYMAIIYNDVLNTGLLKKQWGDFTGEVQKKLELNQDLSFKDHNKFLFENLSDGEIDEVFNSIRG